MLIHADKIHKCLLLARSLKISNGMCTAKKGKGNQNKFYGRMVMWELIG